MIKNSYIKDKGNSFEPIYVPNEIYSFYINFDEPISDPSFNNFSLNLMDGDDIVSPNLGVLKKDIVFSITYNIWCEFIFPFVKNGCYRFAIIDDVTGIIKVKSNCIHVEKDFFQVNTALLHYKHKRNIFGFNYENIPDFYNRFRLPLNKIEYQFDVDKSQYRNVSDKKLRNLYSYRDKFVKIESYYFDEPAHDAMSAVYEQSDIIIDGTRYLPKDAYVIETNQTMTQNKGTVNAYEQERVFFVELPSPGIFVLGVDGDVLLADGNNNLINIY